MDYKSLYFTLFNTLTDAIELLDNGNTDVAKELLIAAQQKAEDMFIEDNEE